MTDLELLAEVGRADAAGDSARVAELMREAEARGRAKSRRRERELALVWLALAGAALFGAAAVTPAAWTWFDRLCALAYTAFCGIAGAFVREAWRGWRQA